MKAHKSRVRTGQQFARWLVDLCRKSNISVGISFTALSGSSFWSVAWYQDSDWHAVTVRIEERND